MTRTTTVSGIRPDKAGDGEWIDINGHVGRLMSTLMADGRPFSIDAAPGGMTTVTPLPPPKDAEAAGGDAQAETEPADGRITSRKTLYDRFRARLKENLDGLNKYGIEALGFCTDYYANNYPIYLLYNQAKRANDWQLAHEWRFCYTIVHAANDAVTNLHKAGLDAPTYERYLCEARFLRACS